MAGEIEEPFRLDFQVDSVHSGSISFGRFENEALCWERRSSFSHNRYLEEVEKCSKPGSVTEKKAYFEAHFRKKGFLGLNAPVYKDEMEYDTEKNDIAEKMDNSEETSFMNDVTHYEGTDVFGTSFSEPQHNELARYPNDLDYITEHVKAVASNGIEIGNSPSVNSQSEIYIEDNLDGESAGLDECCVLNMVVDKFPDDHKTGEKPDPSPEDLLDSSSKEKNPTEAEYMKPGLIPQDKVEERRSYTSSSTSKTAEGITVAVRSKAEKTSSAPKKRPTRETSKYKLGSKTEGVAEFNRGEKQLINRSTMGSQSSTSEKISSRAHQSANRVCPAVGANKPHVKQDNSGFSFKSDERAQRRKEFDIKLEEKMHANEAKMHQIHTMTQEKKNAELKQLRKSLNFKAIPMPSFYRRASLEQDGSKANKKPQKQGSKSSTPGIKVSENSKAGKERPVSRSATTRITDPPQASATSCHSTVTSESSASSHAGTSNHHPSQSGATLLSKNQQRKNNLTSLQRNKVPERNQMYKGKTFNSSSRSAHHRAVGIVSYTS